MKLPEYKISLTIVHNEYKNWYYTIEQGIQEIDENNWVSLEERDKALQTENIWNIQWYPDTPIGSYVYYASSLEVLLDYINKKFKNDNHN